MRTSRGRPVISLPYVSNQPTLIKQNAAARYREMIGYDLPREERLARLKRAIDRLEREPDDS